MTPKGLVFAVITVGLFSLTCAGVDAADMNCSIFASHNTTCCSDCHDMASCDTPNEYCVPGTIETPNSGSKVVEYNNKGYQIQGAGGGYRGVCEVCHTQTKYHRNEGSGDHSHYADRRCGSCHRHGPTTMTNTAYCYTCHGGEAGSIPEGDPPMFTSPASTSHLTHNNALKGPLLGDIGDDPGCTACHKTETGGGIIFADDEPFATTTVCDACHSTGGTYDGVNDPDIGAKANWNSGVYSGNALAAGKEKWCATCHDEVPAVMQGISAPNIIGDEDAATAYGTGYGFYKTGHGLAIGTYPASGAPAANAGCLDCHDSAKSHIDGNARTYSAAADNYQAGYRLRDIGGGAPMDIPRTDNDADSNPLVADFALCFDCHQSAPYLVQANLTTNFRTAANEHWRHVQAPPTGAWAGGGWWDSDWDGATGDSKLSCTACHNVHGSPSPRMVRHGELISTPGTTDKVPSINFKYTPTATYPHLAESTGGRMNPTALGGGSVANTGICAMCHSNTASYSRTPNDLYPPTIHAVYGTSGSNVLTIDFSKSVYTTTGASGALVAEDFTFTDLDNGRTITGVTHSAGDDIATLTLSTSLDADNDIDTDTLAAATGTSIYDASDNAMVSAPVAVTTDGNSPNASSPDPENGVTGVSTDKTLSLTISDSDIGVDFTTFSITLSGNRGYNQTYTDSDISVVSKTGTRKHYVVTINPDTNFSLDEIITVTINVNDHAGNSLVSPAWAFTTTDVPIPQTITLHPSGVNTLDGAWITEPVADSWAAYLDSNDGDDTYAALCCTNGGHEFYVDMDNPTGLEGATIQSIKFHAYVRFRSGPGPGILNIAGDANIGFRTGAATIWKGNTTTDGTTSYNLISSDSYTTDSDGGALDLADINNLQITVQRNTAGATQIRVTEVYVEITYLP